MTLAAIGIVLLSVLAGRSRWLKLAAALAVLLVLCLVATAHADSWGATPLPTVTPEMRAAARARLKAAAPEPVPSRIVTQSVSLVPRYSLVATSDPSPMRLLATAPLVLSRSKGCACQRDSIGASSWMQVVAGLQRVAVDRVHPHFAPESLYVSRWVAPGDTCTIVLNHQQPGDVYLFAWRNGAGRACWSYGKPLEAW